MSRGVIAQIDVKRCTSEWTAHFLLHFSSLNTPALAEVLQHRYHDILSQVGARMLFEWKFAKQSKRGLNCVPEVLSSSSRKAEITAD